MAYLDWDVSRRFTSQLLYGTTDIDECNTNENNCDIFADCANSDPGFNCQCQSGYRDRDTTNPGIRCGNLRMLRYMLAV